MQRNTRDCLLLLIKAFPTLSLPVTSLCTLSSAAYINLYHLFIIGDSSHIMHDQYLCTYYNIYVCMTYIYNNWFMPRNSWWTNSMVRFCYIDYC